MNIIFDSYGDGRLGCGTLELFVSADHTYDGQGRFSECKEKDADYKITLEISSDFFEAICRGVCWFATMQEARYTETHWFVDCADELEAAYYHNVSEKFDYEWTAIRTDSDEKDRRTISCGQRNWREPIFSVKDSTGTEFYGDNILEAATLYRFIDQHIRKDVFIYFAKEYYRISGEQ